MAFSLIYLIFIVTALIIWLFFCAPVLRIWRRSATVARVDTLIQYEDCLLQVENGEIGPI